MVSVDDFSVKFEVITRDIARGYLDLNPENRKVDKKRLRSFSDQMIAGEWEITHQGIAIHSETGYVVDGQHRLMAVEETGIPMTALVTIGPISFDKVDTGKSRTHADTLHVAGHLNAPTLAATVKMVYAYDTGHARPWSGLRGSLSHADIRLLADGMEQHIEDDISVGRAIGRRLRGTGSGGSIPAALYVIHRWCKAQVLEGQYDEFVDGLRTGVGMREDDPRLAIASWLDSAGRFVKNRDHRSELVMMLFIRAFTAWLRQEPLKRMLVPNAVTWTHRLERAPQESTTLDAVPHLKLAALMRPEPVEARS